MTTPLAQMKRWNLGLPLCGAAAVITPILPRPWGGPPGRGGNLEVPRHGRNKLAPVRRSVGGAWDPDRPAVPVKDRDWDTCLGCSCCTRSAPGATLDPKTLLWDVQKCISCIACVSRCPVGRWALQLRGHRHPATEKFSERQPVEVFPVKAGPERSLPGPFEEQSQQAVPEKGRGGKMEKRILMLATGGGPLPPRRVDRRPGPGHHFRKERSCWAYVPGIGGAVPGGETVQLMNLDSTNAGPSHWLESMAPGR